MGNRSCTQVEEPTSNKNVFSLSQNDLEDYKQDDLQFRTINHESIKAIPNSKHSNKSLTRTPIAGNRKKSQTHSSNVSEIKQSKAPKTTTMNIVQAQNLKRS